MSDAAPGSASYVLAPAEGQRLNVVGDEVRVLAEGTRTGERCFIFELRTQPGGGPPLHRHGVDDEYFFVIEGSYRFVIDGREVSASAGSFVHAARGSQHTFVNCGSTTGRMLIVTSPAGLEGPFRRVHDASAVGPPPIPTLVEIFAAFQLSIEGPPLGKG
jgi:quercetin dioxygenase-like cupin family protein